MVQGDLGKSIVTRDSVLGEFAQLFPATIELALCAILIALIIGLFGITYAVVMAHARAFMTAQEIGRGVTFMNFLFMGGAGVVQFVSGRLVNGLAAGGFDPPTSFAWLFAFMGVALAATLALSPAAPVCATTVSVTTVGGAATSTGASTGLVTTGVARFDAPASAGPAGPT